jgi:hypothetical protein
MKRLGHPLNSLDLSPCHFGVLGGAKTVLRNRRSVDSDDIVEALMNLFDNVTFEELQRAFQSWIRLLGWVIPPLHGRINPFPDINSESFWIFGMGGLKLPSTHLHACFQSRSLTLKDITRSSLMNGVYPTGNNIFGLPVSAAASALEAFLRVTEWKKVTWS